MASRPGLGSAGPALAVALLLVPATQAQTPQGTAFTYQGRLAEGGTSASGPYDFQFLLYDAATGGSQVGPVVTYDDVGVMAGLFTVALDFGEAFSGSKRFLEIRVRAGASSGGYTSLLPRQELTPGPAALFSASAPWSGVSGKPAGFADDTDNDALGGLSCMNGRVAKWSGSAWTCGVDIDTNSGGTVTSVGAGAGLTGGPITGTGTLAVAAGGITAVLLADGAVTAPKIASGAVGLGQIDQAQVQARVGGVCSPGQYLRGINSDGSVVCEPVFASTSIKTVDDPANSVGSYSSIADGADGLPVISYHDATAGALKVAKCANLACTAGTLTLTVDDPANNVGQYTSIAIGADGLPVISYYDATAFSLKVAKCGNAYCSTSTRTTVDDPPANSVGSHSSMAIGADGVPVISYYDATALALKVVKCGNASCNNANTFTTVDDSASNVGQYTSIAIGAGGRPVISYYDATAGALKVARCGNAACTAANSLFTVDDSVDPSTVAGVNTSIAIGAAGLPVISYREQYATELRLKVARCGNAACTSGNTIHIVDPFDASPGAIAVGSDGLPVISYYTAFTCGLHVAKCGNAGCTAGNLLTSVDSPSGSCSDFMGPFSSIAIGSDGLPVISYWHSIGALKVAKCSTVSCR